MPFVFRYGRYVNVHVIARLKVELGRLAYHQIGHFRRQHKRFGDYGVTKFVRACLAVFQYLLNDIAKQRQHDPYPKFATVKEHDQEPWYGAHVEKVEHLKVAALAYERQSKEDNY